MNRKNNLLLLAATIVTVLNFHSCSKYEDNPAFSLSSKNSRLAGEWEVVKINGQTVENYFEDYFTSYSPSSYSFDVNADITWEFDKDGDVSNEISGTVNITMMSYYGTTYTYAYPLGETDNGEWEWEDNKESIEIDWDNNSTEEWEIKKLTKKELIVEDENGVEYELEKN